MSSLDCDERAAEIRENAFTIASGCTRYSRMSETENATGAASRGRKLQSARVGTLKSSIVQYWDK